MRASSSWLLFGACAAVLGSARPVHAGDWLLGDVFIGVAAGRYEIRSPDGSVTRDILDDGLGGTTTGCLVDDAGNLWTTDWDGNEVVVYSGVHPHPVLQRFTTPGVTGPFGDTRNECVLIDALGNLYLGHADGDGDLHRYDLAGNLQQEYDCQTQNRGTDWFDLARDGRTLFYTSEGTTVFRYDLATSTQLPPFATLPLFSESFALRLLPPGDGTGGLLVASHAVINMLDGTGAVVRTWDAPGVDNWFALSLDPDGRTFWSADVYLGRVFRFDLAGGPAVTEFTVAATFVGGLCLAGELRASRPCGNGVVEAGEQCDDGNSVPGDGCDALCRAETCDPAGLPEIANTSLRVRKVGVSRTDVEVTFDAAAVPSVAEHVNTHRGTIAAFATPAHYDHGASPGGCRLAAPVHLDPGAAAIGTPNRYYLAAYACAGTPADAEGSLGQAWNGAVFTERPSVQALGAATCP